MTPEAPRPAPPRFRYPTAPVAVVFLDRPNRYRATVRAAAGGRRFAVHVPNPGRMEELLVPGVTRGFAVPAPGPDRQTRFDLVSVRHGRTLVSIDPRRASGLARAALAQGLLAGAPRGGWRPEVAYGGSRLDFGRFDPRGRLVGLVEVKSSNLRVGATALFPDAPTARGARHLRALARARRSGRFAGLLFLVQRPDVRAFAPNARLDPEFARALRAAVRAGVRVWAVTLRVGARDVVWGRRLPVRGSPAEEPLL